MPAVRQPTSVLEARGTFDEHPARGRARANEPQAGGVGPAPEHLTEVVRGCWDEIVAACAPGVFQSSDRVLLERMATFLARSRYNPSGFGSRQETLLLTMLARCGMTPSDRSRVFVPAPPKADGRPRSGLAAFRR